MLGLGAIAAGSIADSAVAATSDVTLALTGLSVTTAQGSLGVSTEVAVPGTSVATAQGTLTPVITAGDVTLALTGLSATTAQGALGVAPSISIPGQVSTAAQGTLGVKNDKLLAGQSATTAQGTLGVDTQIAAVGQSSATAQGTLGLKSDKELTGQSATVSQGTLGVDAKFGLAGSQVTTAQGIITASIGGDLTLPLTGLEVAASQGIIGVQKDITIAMTGIEIGASMGAFNLQRTNDLTGQVSAVSQGSLIRAELCSLDYAESGHVDNGYVCATESSVIADIMGWLMAQATPVNVVDVNTVRVGGSGATWGPSSPPYSGTYTSVGGIPDITAALVAALNATNIPANIKQVNSVAIMGNGQSTTPWGPV